jgi:uncharacterized protein YeaO (DUF488 family)
VAPSQAAVQFALAAETPRQWQAFVKRYRRELAAPDKVRLLKLLAALSRDTNFSIGCYCDDETRCHRSVLRVVLRQYGARIA